MMLQVSVLLSPRRINFLFQQLHFCSSSSPKHHSTCYCCHLRVGDILRPSSVNNVTFSFNLNLRLLTGRCAATVPNLIVRLFWCFNKELRTGLIQITLDDCMKFQFVSSDFQFIWPSQFILISGIFQYDVEIMSQNRF